MCIIASILDFRVFNAFKFYTSLRTMTNQMQQNEDFNLYLDETSRVSALDLYEDLLCTDNDKGTALTVTEVNIERRQLEEQNQLLLQQLSKATANLKSITEQNNALKQNFACLLETAKTELERKNKVIARLSGVTEPRNHQRQVVKTTGQNVLSLKGRRIDDDKSTAKTHMAVESQRNKTTTVPKPSHTGDSGMQLFPEKLVPPNRERLEKNNPETNNLKRKHSPDELPVVKRSKENNTTESYRKLKDPHIKSREESFSRDSRSSRKDSRDRSLERRNKRGTRESDSRRDSYSSRTDSQNSSRIKHRSPDRTSKEKLQKLEVKRDPRRNRDDRSSDLRRKLVAQAQSTEKCKEHLNPSRQRNISNQGKIICKDSNKKLSKHQTKPERRSHPNETTSSSKESEVIRVVEPLKRKADSSTDSKSDKTNLLTTEKELNQIPVLGKIQETSHFSLITDKNTDRKKKRSLSSTGMSNHTTTKQAENVYQEKDELSVKKGISSKSEVAKKTNIFQHKQLENKEISPTNKKELKTSKHQTQPGTEKHDSSVSKKSQSSIPPTTANLNDSAKFDIPNLDIYDQLDFNEDSLSANFENGSKSLFKQPNKNDTDKTGSNDKPSDPKSDKPSQHCKKLKLVDKASSNKKSGDISAKSSVITERNMVVHEKSVLEGNFKTCTLPSNTSPKSAIHLEPSSMAAHNSDQKSKQKPTNKSVCLLSKQLKSPHNVLQSTVPTAASSAESLTRSSTNTPSVKLQTPHSGNKENVEEKELSVGKNSKQNNSTSNDKSIGESFMHYYRNASLHCLLHLARKKLSLKKSEQKVKDSSQNEDKIKSPGPTPTKSRAMWLASLEECQQRRKLRSRWMSEKSDEEETHTEIPTELSQSAEITRIEPSNTSCGSLSWTRHEESMNRFFGLADVVKVITPIKSISSETSTKGCATELKNLQRTCRKVLQSPTKHCS
uniref:Structure-specific endonuclease subunit slx4-like n=1 Tax=Phallusia mammillata TaxID=59560 RepID=A0A6F9DSF0_9ASCI|nr:structure-specific endonuclease subunit slx4-like [Phallusia mammillata]